MIAICPNPFRDHELRVSLQLVKSLNENGMDSWICPVFSEDEPDVLPNGLIYRKLEESVNDCTLAIVVGGDGTILSVARTLQGSGVPIVGVNLGTKGFLANVSRDKLFYALDAARGNLRISRRMMLEIKLRRNGEIIFTDHVLNDAVIHGYGDCIGFTAFCNGDKMLSFSGDGIIAATPTGSTGYSMSAGGPIVEPDAANIILSPICAHRMGSRSFVLDPSRTVVIQAERLHSRRAYLSVDGTAAADLQNGDELIVSRSPYETRMAVVGEKSFFDIAYDKLM